MARRICGVAPVGNDGHLRITKGDGYELIGGSKETHERLQEVAVRVGEGLHRSGRSIHEASDKEISDRLQEAVEKVAK